MILTRTPKTFDGIGAEMYLCIDRSDLQPYLMHTLLHTRLHTLRQTPRQNNRLSSCQASSKLNTYILLINTQLIWSAKIYRSRLHYERCKINPGDTSDVWHCVPISSYTNHNRDHNGEYFMLCVWSQFWKHGHNPDCCADLKWSIVAASSSS